MDTLSVLRTRATKPPANGRLLLGALLFVCIGAACSNEGKPLANPSPHSFENMGFSVSIDGGTAFVGAARSDSVSPNAGEVVVYAGSGGFSWPVDTVLVPSMPSSNGTFGWSVALDEDRAVIGAPAETQGFVLSGSAYFFSRSAGSWVEDLRVTGTPTESQDGFGSSVATDGDWAAIGAPFPPEPFFQGGGRVYVYRHDGSTWLQDTILAASDENNGQDFGYSVSVSGDVVLVGARFDDQTANNAGAAYVFRHDGSSWSEEAKLLAPDGAASDRFGTSVSVSGGLALVGAPRDDDDGDDSGSVYFFVHQPATGAWLWSGKATASDAGPGDEYGRSVDLDGTDAIVGAWLADGAVGTSGAAYVYGLSAASWQMATKLVPDTAEYGDGFGFSVSLSNDCALVGAPNVAGDEGDQVGAAYLYCDLPGPADPGFVLDIICCEIPPVGDPVGPVTFQVRLTREAGDRLIVPLWAELTSPDGVRQRVVEVERIVVSAGDTQERTYRFSIPRQDATGRYSLDVLAGHADGVVVANGVFER